MEPNVVEFPPQIQIQGEVRQMPVGLLTKLRALHQTQKSLIEGCIEGMGIDTTSNRVNFDIDSGLITITPL